MKTWHRVCIGTVGLLVLVFIVGSWWMACLFIRPQQSVPVWPPSAGYEPESVRFPARDGITLRGWFLPNPATNKAIILLHGVAANREQMLARALWFHEMGYNVLLYDARGCGESAQVSRSFGWFEKRDLLGALDWLQAHGDRQIVCDGFSQGAATILLAAKEMPPAVCGVIAESPYTTLASTVDAHFHDSTGFSSRWGGALIVPIAELKLGFMIRAVSPLQEVSHLHCPLLVMGGTSDSLVTPQDIQAIFNSAQPPKQIWLVPWAGHGDFFSYATTEYETRVKAFLENCFKSNKLSRSFQIAEEHKLKSSDVDSWKATDRYEFVVEAGNKIEPFPYDCESQKATFEKWAHKNLR